MLSGFFIDRPKLSIVISIVIVLAGLLALAVIPVAQFPTITPPEIQVSATCPGADAETVANAVAAPIETQINGVENALYIKSTSSNTGRYSLTVTFAIGSNPDIDQVNVQNRLQLAQSQLPAAVTQQGLTLRKASSGFLMAVNLTSPDGKLDDLFISNYANVNILQPISRLPGVGNTQILGLHQYSMRIRLRMVEEIGGQGALKPFVGKQLAPARLATREGIDAHIRATGITVHHPLGTCRMGLTSDPMAVVDPTLRVIGMERLRVIDASVMPDLVGGNINAAVVMIGEKAADLILEREPAS
jgi:choline dehydrogenase-like flavoprotein